MAACFRFERKKSFRLGILNEFLWSSYGAIAIHRSSFQYIFVWPIVFDNLTNLPKNAPRTQSHTQQKEPIDTIECILDWIFDGKLKTHCMCKCKREDVSVWCSTPNEVRICEVANSKVSSIFRRIVQFLCAFHEHCTMIECEPERELNETCNYNEKYAPTSLECRFVAQQLTTNWRATQQQEKNN